MLSLDQDDRSFTLSLYHKYYGLVRKTIFNITQDQSSIEDLINDTFIKLIERIFVLRRLDSYKTAAYVVYTSRSVALNFVKHRDIQRKHGYLGWNTNFSDDIPDPGESIEDLIIYREEIDTMVNAVSNLPKQQKNLLYFKYMLEMKDYEIAEILGIASNSVREYLTRARRKTRELMEKECVPMQNNREKTFLKQNCFGNLYPENYRKSIE